MIELENKINLFRGIVWGEAKAKSEKELYDSADKNAENLKAQHQELEEQRKEYVERRRKAAEFRSKSSVSMQREENKKAILAAKAQCLGELMEELEHALIEYRKTDEYREKLFTKLQEEKNAHGDATVSVRSDDRETARKAGWSEDSLCELEEKEIGGYAITDAQALRRRRETLRALLEDHSYEIGRALYAIWEEKRA